MAFGTNYENIPQGGNLVPEGDYECIITNAEIKKTHNGKYKVGFMLTIRNDIRQECQNRVLFMDIWRKKEPTPADEQVDGFNFAQLMAVSRAAQIPSGQSFESLEQFMQALCGRLLLAKVKHETYNGSTNAKVDPLSTAPTAFPECRHVQKQKTQTPAYGAAAPVRSRDMHSGLHRGMHSRWAISRQLRLHRLPCRWIPMNLKRSSAMAMYRFDAAQGYDLLSCPCISRKGAMQCTN